MIYDLHVDDLRFTSQRFTSYISTIYDLHLKADLRLTFRRFRIYIKELHKEDLSGADPGF